MSKRADLVIDAQGVFKQSRVTVTDEHLILESGLGARSAKRRAVPLGEFDYIEVPGLSHWGTVTIGEVYVMTLALTLAALLIITDCVLIEHVPILVDRLITLVIFCIAMTLSAWLSSLSTQRLYIMANGERLMMSLKLKGSRAERAAQLKALISEVKQRRDTLKLRWMREQLQPTSAGGAQGHPVD